MTRHPSPDRPVNVLIVDDHAIFAEVLAMRLEAEPYVASVHTAGSVAAARAKIRAVGDGVVFLDYHLGDECGLDLVEPISRLEAPPHVVIVSASHDPDEILEALQAGVDAWVVKSQGFDALVEITADVIDGMMYLPPTSLREVITRHVAASDAPTSSQTFLDTITPRERDVLDGLMAGLSRSEIATRLFVSPNTVRTHVRHLLERADVHSSVALVARAREAGYSG